MGTDATRTRQLQFQRGAAVYISRPNVLQAVWVDDPKSNYYIWEPPVNGVRWYADKQNPEQMFFEPLTRTSAEKYGHFAGPQKAQGRKAWVKLHGSDPMAKADNPAPISVEALLQKKEQEMKSFQGYAAKGEERYGKLKAAKRALGLAVSEDREKFFKEKYVNKLFGRRDEDSPEASVNYKAVFGDDKLWRDPTKKGLYVNEYDLASGRITADENYGADESYHDRTSGKAERFNNSEVIYQQWRQAKAVLGKNAKAGLDVLRRAHVSGDGIPVVKAVRAYLSWTNETYSEKANMAFDEGHPCFYALLAAANCAAAVFLIADHGLEMGISGIARIVLCAGDSIEIFFR